MKFDIKIINFAKSIIQIETESLLEKSATLGEQFSNAIKQIYACSQKGGKIIVTGMGKSGHIGNKIAATFASTGTSAFFVHPAEAGHGDLGMITPNDLVVAISQSGASDEVLSMIPYLRRYNIPLIAMTGNPESILAQNAVCVIDTAVKQEACPLNLAPTSSTTVVLALGDALAMSVMKLKGIRAEDFAITHPHGKLGRRLLTTISDVMAAGENIPLVTEDTSIQDAIMEISRCGLGFVLVRNVANQIIGIFTDGDLRRALNKDINIKHTPIGEVTKKDFTAMQANELAVAAVERMDKFKISALPIFDDEKLVGVINMRMLLQAGVV